MASRVSSHVGSLGWGTHLSAVTSRKPLLSAIIGKWQMAMLVVVVTLVGVSDKTKRSAARLHRL